MRMRIGRMLLYGRGKDLAINIRKKEAPIVYADQPSRRIHGEGVSSAALSWRSSRVRRPTASPSRFGGLSAVRALWQSCGPAGGVSGALVRILGSTSRAADLSHIVLHGHVKLMQRPRRLARLWARTLRRRCTAPSHPMPPGHSSPPARHVSTPVRSQRPR